MTNGLESEMDDPAAPHRQALNAALGKYGWHLASVRLRREALLVVYRLEEIGSPSRFLEHMVPFEHIALLATMSPELEADELALSPTILLLHVALLMRVKNAVGAR